MVISKPEHEVAYQELAALIGKNAGTMTGLELLAIAANMVGKLIALQDQRTVTPALAMEVVSKNIEIGNEQAIAEVRKAGAGGVFDA